MWHVARLLNEPCELGLILIEGAHRLTISSQLIHVVTIAKPRKLGRGPDLAFIRIPWEKALQIKPYKSFYDLTATREEMLSKPPRRDASVWFVCGIPDEFTTDDPGEAGFYRTKSFHGLCGAGGANRVYRRCRYDYVDSVVQYADDKDLPSTFGGISGGGLWQVTYSGAPPKVLPQRYLLAGIPFAQTPIKAGLRSIRCHGWRSIYDKSYKEINKACS